MSARRGYTLGELMVAAAVSLVVVAALFQLLVAGARIYMRGSARASLQAAGQLALVKMSADVRRSAMALLTINAPPADAGFALACRPDEPTMVPFSPASYFIIYYLDGNRALIRKSWDASDRVAFSPSPFQTNQRLTHEQLALIVATPNGSERPVASGVDGIATMPGRFPTTGPVTAITITLTLSNVISSETYSEIVTSAFTPRNQL